MHIIFMSYYLSGTSFSVGSADKKYGCRAKWCTGHSCFDNGSRTPSPMCKTLLMVSSFASMLKVPT